MFGPPMYPGQHPALLGADSLQCKTDLQTERLAEIQAWAQNHLCPCRQHQSPVDDQSHAAPVAQRDLDNYTVGLCGCNTHVGPIRARGWAARYDND